MAATLTFSAASSEPLNPVTVTVAGATADTEYNVVITRPGGNVSTLPITTDGDGGATALVATGNTPGLFSVELRIRRHEVDADATGSFRTV